MVDDLHPLARPLKGCAICQLSDGHIEAGCRQLLAAALARRADETADVVPLPQEVAREMSASESGDSSDQEVHGRVSALSGRRKRGPQAGEAAASVTRQWGR